MRLQVYSIVFILVLAAAVAWWFKTRDACVVLRRIPTHDGVIEIVDDACQEGLPHTTDSNTIRMTEAAYADPRAERTLIHERVHLNQKRHRNAWIAFYKEAWGYTLLKSPPQDLNVALDIRPNPDTADAPWAVWNDRYVFFPNYGPQRTLRGAVVRVWDKHTGAFLSEPPPAWRTFFCDTTHGCPHQYEHPHEMAAEYIAEGSISPAAQKLFAWKR